MQPYTLDIDDAFGHWLAGLADGEAHFGIHLSGRDRSCWRFTFQIKLRDDDSSTLEEIYRRLPLGGLTRSTCRSTGQRPTCTWQVQSRDALRLLVGVFDQYPLRSKKARDYSIWREALVNDARGATLAQFAARLRATREYPLLEEAA